MTITQNLNNAICNLKKNKKDKDFAPSKFHPCAMYSYETHFLTNTDYFQSLKKKKKKPFSFFGKTTDTDLPTLPCEAIILLTFTKFSMQIIPTNYFNNPITPILSYSTSMLSLSIHKPPFFFLRKIQGISSITFFNGALAFFSTTIHIWVSFLFFHLLDE